METFLYDPLTDGNPEDEVSSPKKALWSIALKCRVGASILIHEVMMKLFHAVSITALILLIRRLVVRNPPSLPYRLQKDEWSKIRGYRRPS
jgi:hypothetical protein